MPVNQIAVERWSLVSPKPFAEIVAALDAAFGHPDMREFGLNVMKAASWQELEHVVHAAVGRSGFMEFARFNLGQIIQKEQGPAAPKMLRIVFGNPLIMKQMAEHVHDAASYAPVTVLIDEREDGVRLSYDRMASYIAPYGNLAALEVARELDLKVEHLLTKIAN
ncbi:MAG: DUF302 domain-containing protein [Terracidiphilus sp.]